MKLSLLLLSAAALVAGAAAVTAAPQTGAAAPNFTLVDTNGQTHSLADFKGKTVVLEWTNHECPFVVKHYSGKNMQNLQKKWTGQGVVWLQIVSSAPGAQGFVNASQGNELRKTAGHAATAMLLDPEGTVGKLYNARTTPHMYVINPQGVLVYQGAIDSKRSASAADIATSVNYVDQALTEMMAGKPVSQPETQPYGCSVKYKN